MIWANDKLYTFREHAENRMIKRGLKVEWIEHVMNNPERYEVSEISGHQLYVGHIEGRERPLFVFVDEENAQIVTAYFQKSL